MSLDKATEEQFGVDEGEFGPPSLEDVTIDLGRGNGDCG